MPLPVIDENSAHQCYIENKELSSTTSWEEVKACGFLYRLLELQAATSQQRGKQ
jgi:hypothetical protein